MKHILLAALIAALPLVARGTPAVEPARTIDMTAALHNPDGSVMRECKQAGPSWKASGMPTPDSADCAQAGAVTVGEVVVGALNKHDPNGSPLAQDVAMARGQLAMRLLGEKTASLTEGQIGTIETLVFQLGAPATMTEQVVLALDPAYRGKIDETKLQ